MNSWVLFRCSTWDLFGQLLSLLSANVCDTGGKRAVDFVTLDLSHDLPSLPLLAPFTGVEPPLPVLEEFVLGQGFVYLETWMRWKGWSWSRERVGFSWESLLGVGSTQQEHSLWKTLLKHDQMWSPQGWVTVLCKALRVSFHGVRFCADSIYPTKVSRWDYKPRPHVYTHAKRSYSC